MKRSKKSALRDWLSACSVASNVALSSLASMSAVHAAETDFSCMSHKVWSKSHLSDQFREYDVVLQNNCPGPVYWSMCIERIDPYSTRILEAHTPNGYIEAEQKIRVNLQIKKATEAMDFRQRFQEFYVATDYAINPPARARCIAISGST